MKINLRGLIGPVLAGLAVQTIAFGFSVPDEYALAVTATLSSPLFIPSKAFDETTTNQRPSETRPEPSMRTGVRHDSR